MLYAVQCFPYIHSAAARRRCWIFAAAKNKKYNRCQSMPLIGGPLRGPPINGMDQAVLDQEGDMNTFNNRIYPNNCAQLYLKAIKWKTCLFGVRCVWMCGSSGRAVHVNSGVREGSPPRRIVTRDVVHVNSGVREGSPPRRSYEGCATIVLKNTFF